MSSSPSVSLQPAVGISDEVDNKKECSKISEEEIKSAFSFLDMDKTGQVTLANLKKRLGVFFPDMTPKEYKFLMNNRKELTIEDLNELLADNEISDISFDPVAEAFKAYDHKGVGSIKKERLREVFDSYGLSGPTLSEEELNMIVRNADVDGDGVVTLEDFRALVSAKQKGDAPGASDSSNIDGGKS